MTPYNYFTTEMQSQTNSCKEFSMTETFISDYRAAVCKPQVDLFIPYHAFNITAFSIDSRTSATAQLVLCWSWQITTAQMLIISLCNMLMISCRDPQAEKQKHIKVELSQTRQRCPSMFKMKTALVREAKSTRNWSGEFGWLATSQAKH